MKARITTPFTYLNKDTFRKTCRELQLHLDTDVEADINFFEKLKSILFLDIFM